jgi:hypothetical protein
MIGDILKIVAKEVSDFIDKGGDLPSDKKSVILHKPNKINEKFNIPDNSISLSLLNIEEEKVVRKSATAVKKVIEGKVYQHNPPVNINLQIIFISSFKNDYISELNYITKVIEFFQQKPTLTSENTKELGALGVEKLNFRLNTLTLEKQNTLWSLLGSQYMPSLVYKVSMIVIQEEMRLTDIKLVKEVEIDMEIKR